MFVVRDRSGQITAAYLNEQFAGQEWLPIDSRLLQRYLVAAPKCSSMSRGGAGRRHKKAGDSIEASPVVF